MRDKASEDVGNRIHQRRMEIYAFLIITAILMPFLAVATVGSYGLAVWIYQTVAGPPGPPKTRVCMAVTPFHRQIGRRDFIRASWTVSAATETAPLEIASILVRARPERLDTVVQAIGALSGAQIYGRDPKGKLVVVLEGSDVGAIGTTLNTISMIPDVLAAALVFHGTDDGEIQAQQD
jgi:nitrate reductase NapD